MTIYEKVKSDLKIARLARNSHTVTFLSTLLGEFDLKATMVDGVKTVSDEDAQNVLKKFVKNIDEMFSATNGGTLNVMKAETLKMERFILLGYMPQQMTDEELRQEIRMLVIANNAALPLGEIMKHLKENFAGQYDGKMASQIAKEFTSWPL